MEVDKVLTKDVTTEVKAFNTTFAVVVEDGRDDEEVVKVPDERLLVRDWVALEVEVTPD